MRGRSLTIVVMATAVACVHRYGVRALRWRLPQGSSCVWVVSRGIPVILEVKLIELLLDKDQWVLMPRD